MATGRCTLRNIAQRCEVSTAVVSTVLNNRQGRISCSDAMRKKILETARQMNYVPNVLARSMRQKRVPLVGVFLRQDPETGILSRSTTKTLSAAAKVLTKHHFETIFVPFTNSQSQHERMRSLISRGLLGGIITCIINEGDLFFRQMPYPDYFLWNAPTVSAEKVRALEDESLLVVMGIKICEQLLSQGFECRNCVIMEFAEEKNRVPETFDAAFVHQTSAKAEHIEELYLSLAA